MLRRAVDQGFYDSVLIPQEGRICLKPSYLSKNASSGATTSTEETHLTSPSFPMIPGPWTIGFAFSLPAEDIPAGRWALHGDDGKVFADGPLSALKADGSNAIPIQTIPADIAAASLDIDTNDKGASALTGIQLERAGGDPLIPSCAAIGSWRDVR